MTAFHVFLAGLVVIVVVRLLQHSRRCSSSEELDTIRCLPSFGFAAATMLQHVATANRDGKQQQLRPVTLHVHRLI